MNASKSASKPTVNANIAGLLKEFAEVAMGHEIEFGRTHVPVLGPVDDYPSGVNIALRGEFSVKLSRCFRTVRTRNRATDIGLYEGKSGTPGSFLNVVEMARAIRQDGQ